MRGVPGWAGGLGGRSPGRARPIYFVGVPPLDGECPGGAGKIWPWVLPSDARCA